MDLVYKNQKYLKKSLLGRLKSVKEFFIIYDNTSFAISSEDKLRIVMNLKTFVALSYVSFYVKKSKGNVYFIKFLKIYYRIFSYLFNILFFPVIDFNSDKFSLRFRSYFDSSEYRINLKNLLVSNKFFGTCSSFEVLYNFSIHNKLWLFRNFPTFKILLVFLLKSFPFGFINSTGILYIFDVFFTFFNFSLNGLVCNKYIIFVLRFVLIFFVMLVLSIYINFLPKFVIIFNFYYMK